MSRIARFLVVASCLLTVGLVVFTPQTAQAETHLAIDCNKTGVDAGGRPTITNHCTVQDFFQQFVNLAQFAYGIVVIIGVLMFVYGGYQFLIAAGRQDKIAEGKRVIIGTIIGLFITFTAYIIVNFTVSAITDSPIRSLNPFSFGSVSTVFPDDNELKQPFSGSGSSTPSTQNWDKTCDGTSKIYQVYCQDSSTTGGDIKKYQKQIEGLGCNCGSADGIFGMATVACVRRFQIANFIDPSGAIGPNTKTTLGGSPNRCDDPAYLPNSVESKLPALNSDYASLASKSATLSGCCVVGERSQPFYCLDKVSQRTCSALGSYSYFDSSNANCLADADTKNLCGLCADTTGKRCIASGSYWCLSVLSPPQQFNKGEPCVPGSAICSNGCLSGLRTGPPFYQP